MSLHLQDVDLSLFDTLDSGDVLFIDSSHVSKIGSDVNREILDILPRLKPGVWIHVHDIFYPFEYPRQSVYAGRFWNEAYLLQAFLACNDHFKIRMWSSYLNAAHRESVASVFPEIAGISGGSIWIERTS